MTIGDAVKGLRWYVRQATGEAKWDEYVEECRQLKCEPMSRRDFERHRTEHRSADPKARCC